MVEVLLLNITSRKQIRTQFPDHRFFQVVLSLLQFLVVMHLQIGPEIEKKEGGKEEMIKDHKYLSDARRRTAPLHPLCGLLVGESIPIDLSKTPLDCCIQCLVVLRQ